LLSAEGSTYASFVAAQQLRLSDAHSDGFKHAATAGNSVPIENSEEAQRHFEKGSVADGTGRSKSRDAGSFHHLVHLVYSLNHAERRNIFFGILISGIAGSAYPITGIFFGNAVIALTDPSLTNGAHSPNFWASMFVMLGAVLLITYSIQAYLFANAGSKLGPKARAIAFAAILRQDVSFFDRPENSSGRLTAFLSTEATKLTGISGNTFGAVLNASLTLISGVAVACSYGWELGLVATATMPILLSCAFLRFWVVTQTERRFKTSTDATGFACEAISGIRTVAYLTLEETIISYYTSKLQTGHAHNLLLNIAAALTYTLSQSLTLFVNALLFWYGGTKLIASGKYRVQQFFVCYIAVVFSAKERDHCSATPQRYPGRRRQPLIFLN